MLRLLADEYMAQHNNLEFEFLEGRGSNGAVMAVNAGMLDLCGMSQLPGAPGLDGGFEYIDFATDRIAVVMVFDDAGNVTATSESAVDRPGEPTVIMPDSKMLKMAQSGQVSHCNAKLDDSEQRAVYASCQRRVRTKVCSV